MLADKVAARSQEGMQGNCSDVITVVRPTCSPSTSEGFAPSGIHPTERACGESARADGGEMREISE
jgi:hypothetical protein